MKNKLITRQTPNFALTSDARSVAFGAWGGQIGIEHVHHDFPFPIGLLRPDADVLAFIVNRFSGGIVEAHFVVAQGVAAVAASGGLGFGGVPGYRAIRHRSKAIE